MGSVGWAQRSRGRGLPAAFPPPMPAAATAAAAAARDAPSGPPGGATTAVPAGSTPSFDAVGDMRGGTAVPAAAARPLGGGVGGVPAAAAPPRGAGGELPGPGGGGAGMDRAHRRLALMLDRFASPVSVLQWGRRVADRMPFGGRWGKWGAKIYYF